MATYKGINGFAVQSVASDPSPLDEGQVWYNNATYAFKLATLTTSGTWAAGGNMNTARAPVSGTGTQTAGLAFGGDSGGPTGATELYNGTSWTSNPTGLNTARSFLASTGTQTAALGAGGYVLPSAGSSAVETWNGTSWTASTSLPAARLSAAGVGPQTSALVFAGDLYPTPTRITGTSLLFNGATWTSGGTMNTARRYVGSAGTPTSALGFGGYGPATTAASESYNGTAWTNTPSLNTARSSLAGFGTQTAAVAAGGAPPYTGATETYNGTTWTTNPNSMATARSSLAGAGTQPAGLVFGGNAGGPLASVGAITEEWTGPGTAVTRTITTS